MATMKHGVTEGFVPRFKGGRWNAPIYLHVCPLPSLQDGCCLVLVPVDVRDILVPLEVLIHLLGSH